MTRRKTSITREFETTLKKLDAGVTYVFRLYVAGSSPHSLRAIKNLKRICEKHLKGNYTMEVIDIHQHNEEGEQVLAAPTLIKKLPLPVKRLIGDMSDTAKVLLALNIK